MRAKGRVVLGVVLSAAIGGMSVAVAVVTSLVVAWTSPVKVDIPGIVAAWTHEGPEGSALQVQLNTPGIVTIVGIVLLAGLVAVLIDGQRAAKVSSARGAAILASSAEAGEVAATRSKP